MSTAPTFYRPAPAPPDFEAAATLEAARTLQRSEPGNLVRTLRGKNLGLLCEDMDSAEAQRFCAAAQALGAQVAHIRPSLSRLSTPQELAHTARLLGRLYDAVECQGLAQDIVQQIRAAAGVPVYAGLASTEHPSAGLADVLQGGPAGEASQQLIVQAVLVRAIG